MRRIAPAKPTKPDPLQQCLGARLPLGAGQPVFADRQPKGDVVGHRHMVKQRVILENKADVPVSDGGAGDVLAVEQHLARILIFQPCDDPQQGRLARTRWAEECNEFARLDSKVYAMEGGGFAKMLGDVVKVNQCLAPAWRSKRHSSSVLAASVTSARPANRLATAKAAAKLYSL